MQSNKKILKKNFSRKKILIAFPHPDDETAFTSGIIQRAKSFDAKIFLVCLSKGEKSTLRHGLSKNDILSEIRKNELENALKTLGLSKKDFEIASFPDGNIRNKNSKVRNFISKHIRIFKPEIVITYEPCGVYGHPDHVQLSKIISGIYYSKKFKFKLIYSTICEKSDITKNMSKNILNPEKESEICPLSPNFSLKLTADEIKKKIQAFKCHKSQFIVNQKFIAEWTNKGLLDKENFFIVD